MSAPAYYNDAEPFVAQWLRNLIAAGHIAPGDVDERSIADVHPDDLRGYTQCHFFAGIGGWSYALRLAGWPDGRSVWTGSCPCQPFSVAGKQRGSEDERHLWPAWFRLIRECRPATVFGEQVAGAAGLAWLDHVCADLESEGYAAAAADLPAACVGAPHIRQRLWWVAHRDESGRREQRRAQLLNGERAAQQHDVDGRGAHDEMADDAEQGRRAQSELDAGTHGRPAQEPRRLRDAGGLADSEGGRRGAGYRSEPIGAHDDGSDAAGRRGLGDAERARLQGGIEADLRGARGQAVRGQSEQPGGGQPVRGGDADRGGFARQSRRDGEARIDRASPWAELEWLACRDGKHRPTQPGVFPLAHGVSGRVGRLRAYGNAIVPQVAAAFIGAVMECRP